MAHETYIQRHGQPFATPTSPNVTTQPHNAPSTAVSRTCVVAGEWPKGEANRKRGPKLQDSGRPQRRRECRLRACVRQAVAMMKGMTSYQSRHSLPSSKLMNR
eukprot:TRINITY_DN37846_c0_g1_i1.p2 TRINITY_DN37846_c0_g1~~TRINITY_DN37846_c0_g1_i1.p2  ORF type:complete len:103 (-),score=1.49 TRINITY_DN37846_c0_g1_i1:22-330(-)